MNTKDQDLAQRIEHQFQNLEGVAKELLKQTEHPLASRLAKELGLLGNAYEILVDRLDGELDVLQHGPDPRPAAPAHDSINADIIEETFSRLKRNVHTLAFHHPAANSDPDVETITRWHKARGFWTIGYHGVVRRSGKLEVGRDINRTPAQIKYHNTGFIGICVNATLDGSITAPMKDTMDVIVDIARKHVPGIRVVGHRDMAATECPGDALYAYIKKYKKA